MYVYVHDSIHLFRELYINLEMASSGASAAKTIAYYVYPASYAYLI
jgi:hypothetical protein